MPGDTVTRNRDAAARSKPRPGSTRPPGNSLAPPSARGYRASVPVAVDRGSCCVTEAAESGAPLARTLMPQELPVSTPIVVSDLSFAWPDGCAVFDGLDVVFGAGRTGLVGANGAGKSTLLRLLAGDLAPARGSVAVAGSLGYLPQNITLRRELRADEVLGIAGARAALAAIEAGD